MHVLLHVRCDACISADPGQTPEVRGRRGAAIASRKRTLREWVHRAINPLPAAQVGTKILVRRSTFDHWLENHRLKTIDVGCIVDELVAGVKGAN